MLTKNVNGVDVVMSADEEAATRAEWAANDAAAAAKAAQSAKTIASAPAGSPAATIISDPVQLAALKAAITSLSQ